MTPAAPPALILAGGRSSRMGRDKLLLPFGEDSFLGHIMRRLAPQVSGIAVNAPPGLPLPTGIEAIPDTLPGQPGPLAGVLAGLRDLAGKAGEQTHLLTVPSDAPFFPDDLCGRLQAALVDGKTVAVAASAGRMHPVFALWPLAVADDLEAWLGNPSHRRVSDFLARHRVETVTWDMLQTPIGPLDPFMNVNAPADLQEALRFLEVAR
ncbi:molybdenum cofactor guanylyltransferase [Pseudorhizobium endolithicum]|uniref:Molybdenum cofactor guanylyltransferase n=1 Tax=Pseudorhizobium endolithicum TaxID=1191678 RepID=A0ABN7JS21_9HYPH|nr:molybdenum cofactor guanylyltransferase MobA [Pseudorhizobium endolithicum]CAD7045208.1 molybdenum cofactor guanylyltransferase [Pseudorhizobium endolithicum]